jgi:thiamine transport system permease protein
MAPRAQPLRALAPGLAAAALILALVPGTLVAVALRAEAPSRLGPADWAAVRFTVIQAALSAGLSLALAVPLARALARRSFPGRGLLVTLLGAPFILPVIVAVLGLLAVLGRAGLVSQVLGWAGLPPVSIYGLHGVVLAHVFFNLPLATRLLLQAWQAIPAEHFRLAAMLGMTPADVARRLEWPMLRAVAPGIFVSVFLICLTSFAVALTLGGGPRATTVELAIFQAFRFDFDLGRAALLGLVQVGLTGAAALVALRVAVPAGFGPGLDRPVARWDAGAAALRLQDAALIGAAALFLLLPLAMVAAGGLAGLGQMPAQVWPAALRSVAVALGSAALAVGLALALGLAVVRARRGAGALEALGYLSIAASPMVIGTGLFVVIFPLADPLALALPVTALVNAAMSLPFALRALLPALRAEEADYGRLAASLGMSGAVRLRLVTLPRIRRPLGFAGGLAAALSMGDLGVVALFADPGAGTLPLVMYGLMGSYRMEAAQGAALLLVALSLALFWIIERGGRGRAEA